MRKIRKIIRKLLPYLIILSLVIFSIKFFKVNHIICSTQYGECSQIALGDLQTLLGRSLFTSLPDVSQQITQHDLSVKSVIIKKTFPQTVTATLLLRTPLGQVSNSSKNQFGLVDDSGVIYKVDDKLFFPLLIIDEWQPGIKNISSLHVQSLQALNSVHSILKDPTTGRIESTGVIITSPGHPEILIDPKLPVKQWESSLQVIIDRSKIQNKIPRKIDLRFNQPVLEYK